jgi:uncharacterized circularly permuted ATP-grasp superfamily protein/uncharacterized alpha-E superfamily protein
MGEARLETYLSDTRRYDELLDNSGSVRPHWRPLIDALGSDGADAVRRGVELARRLIVENGVTYNVYADPQGRDRPWVLDPLPILISADEWREIEAGVAQRARLFDALLADIYGPQRLLTDGTVPPQIPSGPGYALENRQIVSRVFPDLLNDVGVRALGAFFVALRDNLLRAAPEEETPLAVVLTPGAFNETYFEHAYLARQLGLPLVEGNDLTVRGDTVYLKTLGGLRRVHAILRRLDDDFCDPVELRADSALGVPGLIGVVRAGRVVLGSGVLESAAWMGFIPAAAEKLLGEKLQLPSVATWWCGEPPALSYVLENLERLVIKPAYPNQNFQATFGRDLDAAAREELIARLSARPHAYVAQERLSFSQAPVWRSSGGGGGGAQVHGFSARALGIRVYAVATPDGFRVMPGGLARIATDAADIVSMQRGGGSKDVWVLAGDRRSVDDADFAGTSPRVAARHDDLPSRMAENLFWLGRYSERCEDKARLFRATLNVRGNALLWPQALETCGHFLAIPKLGETGLPLLDDANTLGLKADLQRLAWCAAQTRSQLSSENWRAISVLQRDFQEGAHFKRDPREILDSLLLSLAGLAGFAMDDMTQNDGWQLLMVGRRLERLQFLSDLLSLRLKSGTTPAQSELEWLLDIGDSTITYRTRYLASPRLGETVDLLVFDQSNPRALAFQWHAIQYSLVRVAASLGGVPDDTLDAAVGSVQEIQLSTVDGDSARAERVRQRLAEQLNQMSLAAGKLSDQLSLKHFSLIDAAASIRSVAA